MEFSLSDEQRSLRDLARRFAYEEVRPAARELEANEDPAACYPKRLIERADAIGLRTLKLPREFGGHAANCLTQVLVLEELCTGDCGFGMSLQHAWREGNALATLTSPSQRERYLDGFLNTPSYMTSLAMSEPEVGSDVSAGYDGDLAAGPRTTVRREEDAWILNGQKRWITNGINASIFFVVARTDRTVPWTRGISVFLVPTDTPGLSVTKVEDKIGLRTNMNCEVIFEDARVRLDDLLGEMHEGRAFLHRMNVGSKAKTAAKSLGIARAAYEDALQLAVAGELRGGQATDEAIARMATEIEATRALMWRAAAAVDAGDPSATALERMAFVKASEVCVDAASSLVELQGHAGLARGTHADKLFRDAVVMLHAGGGNQAVRARVGAILRQEALDEAAAPRDIALAAPAI